MCDLDLKPQSVSLVSGVQQGRRGAASGGEIQGGSKGASRQSPFWHLLGSHEKKGTICFPDMKAHNGSGMK